MIFSSVAVLIQSLVYSNMGLIRRQGTDLEGFGRIVGGFGRICEDLGGCGWTEVWKSRGRGPEASRGGARMRSLRRLGATFWGRKVIPKRSEKQSCIETSDLERFWRLRECPGAPKWLQNQCKIDAKMGSEAALGERWFWWPLLCKTMIFCVLRRREWELKTVREVASWRSGFWEAREPKKPAGLRERQVVFLSIGSGMD